MTFTGMAVNRIKAPGTGSIDFAPLADLADRQAPDVVLADYHLGGNLVLFWASYLYYVGSQRYFGEKPRIQRWAVLAGELPAPARNSCGSLNWASRVPASTRSLSRRVCWAGRR